MHSGGGELHFPSPEQVLPAGQLKDVHDPATHFSRSPPVPPGLQRIASLVHATQAPARQMGVPPEQERVLSTQIPFRHCWR